MLDRYLRDGETVESRIDELLTDARATGARNLDLVATKLAEANVLTALIPAAVTAVSNFSYTQSSPAEVGETLGEPLYTTDDVVKALDGVFDGGQAPTVLRAALLALLVDGLAPVDKVSVEDTALLDPLADGTTPRLPSEEEPRSYVDLGRDLDVTMPEHEADHELADRVEEEPDEFPEFAAEFHPIIGAYLGDARPKSKKKGGKKSAVERAAEEAGA